MRFFFKSRQFKIIVFIFALIVAVSALFLFIGERMAPQTDIAGAVTAPFKQVAAAIKNSISDFSAAYRDGNRLMLENADLKSQLNELREKVADYEQMKSDNDFYKQYLEIKEKSPDLVMCNALLISRDNGDAFKGFVINKGSLSDISLYDPVITDAGLVGYISEVGLTTSKVTTILSTELCAGALNNRTNDSGIITGNLDLAEKGLCRLENLARSCTVAVGDYVITSGEGIFPEGLLIGSIDAIGTDKYNTSIYADIKPFADLDEIRGVMVITSFNGQGGIIPEEEEQ